MEQNQLCGYKTKKDTPCKRSKNCPTHRLTVDDWRSVSHFLPSNDLNALRTTSSKLKHTIDKVAFELTKAQRDEISNWVEVFADSEKETLHFLARDGSLQVSNLTFRGNGSVLYENRWYQIRLLGCDPECNEVPIRFEVVSDLEDEDDRESIENFCDVRGADDDFRWNMFEMSIDIDDIMGHIWENGSDVLHVLSNANFDNPKRHRVDLSNAEEKVVVRGGREITQFVRKFK